MEITRKSPVSGKIRTIDLPVTNEQIKAWQNGEYAQVAFSHLSDGDREFIMTGISNDEWDNLFSEDDEKPPLIDEPTPEPKPGLIIFEYTNAYDVYSANELSSLMGSAIERQEMNADGCYLHCKDIHPVVSIMKLYGFYFEVKELTV